MYYLQLIYSQPALLTTREQSNVLLVDGAVSKTYFSQRNKRPPKRMISVYEFAIFRIFSPLCLAMRQQYSHVSDRELQQLAPGSIRNKTQYFSSQNMGVSTAASFGLFVLLCDFGEF